MEITEICTGCGACATSCPANCIRMIENRFGEFVPQINYDLCLHCGLCEKVCPQNSISNLQEPKKCFVSWSKNPNDIIYSASGGVAAVFLRTSIANDWNAYSCDYDEELKLSHFRVKTEKDIEKARSSKYSQSNAFVVFKEIKSLLNEQQNVLFIGTPCQVAGLRNFLQTEYSNLITVDLVCHGTPPTKYINEHLKSLHLHDKAKRIRFRGQYDQYLTVWDNQSVVYKKHRTEDTYFKAFYANEISRESCYTCKYAQAQRVGDITIGDFWGIGELKNIKKQSDRPSIILVNTENGRKFLKLAEPNLLLEERECIEGIAGNGRLNSAPGENHLAKYFRSLYPLAGFEKAIKGSAMICKLIKLVKG